MNEQDERKEFRCFLKESARIIEDIWGPCDYVGRERHPHGVVGKLWRICDPGTVRVGNCFLKGRLRKDDLFYCIEHSGDCFQTYMYVEESTNALYGKIKWTFGSYGIGDAEEVPLNDGDAEKLISGERVLKGKE